MKNQKILAISLLVVIILGLSFAVAAGDGMGKNYSVNKNKSLENAKKTNYGACVSSQTKIKNFCYKEKRQGLKNCEQQTRNQFKEERKVEGVNMTGVRDQAKERSKACKESYKTGMDTCKQTFNASKQSCESWKCASNQTFGNGTCIPIQA